MTTKATSSANVIDWIISLSKLLGLRAETVFRAISIYKIHNNENQLTALASVIVASAVEDKTISIHRLKKLINIDYTELEISKEVANLADYTVPATCYQIYKELTGQSPEWSSVCYYMLILKLSNLTDEVIAHLAAVRYGNYKCQYKQINKIISNNGDRKFISKLAKTRLKSPKMGKI